MAWQKEAHHSIISNDTSGPYGYPVVKPRQLGIPLKNNRPFSRILW